jgi:hypothetical protein
LTPPAYPTSPSSTMRHYRSLANRLVVTTM